MDCVGRLVERLDVDPHHATMVHAPRQAHQRAIDGLLAPVDERALMRGALSAICSSWTIAARSASPTRLIRSTARHRIIPKAWMKMPY